MPTVFLEIALPTPVRRYFDYLAPDDINTAILKVGMRILVPFGRRTLIGILINVKDSSPYPCKPILKILDDEPVLTDDLYKLCAWAAEYYHYPLGQVFSAALPHYLRQEKIMAQSGEPCYQLSEAGQAISLTELKRSPNQAKLIAYLKQHPDGIKKSQLSDLGVTPQTIKSMLHKTWLSSSTVTSPPEKNNNPSEEPPLNEEQSQAVNTLNASDDFSVSLINGVTGSGKTEVYIRVIKEKLKQHKQILVLVPEIGLTPQTISRFANRFEEPTLAIHSNLNDTERFQAWSLAKTGEVRIIIGTRSAIFTPFQALGLIIIDEEHDASYKQQDNFRYHARDLAAMRAKFLNIPLVLGSATPSIESFYNCMQKRYREITLRYRAGGATPPTFNLIDLRNKKMDQGLSEPLIQLIKKHLDQKNQVLIFLNRRGFAPTLLCHDCGFISHCKRCDTHLILHKAQKELRCHHCQHTEKAPTVCPTCASESLIPVGQGTQRLETALTQHFPNTDIIRIDRDNTRRKNSLHQILDNIEKGEHQLLIGTQMLAKGHHFPNVTLVAMIDVDGGLFSADFRATERLGQLITQVAGRSGRGDKPGEVAIQTHYPDHPLLNLLLQNNYDHFLETLLEERKDTQLPPFSYLAIVRAQANTLKKSIDFLQEVKALFSKTVSCFGPTPALLAKLGGQYRAELLIQSHSRTVLHQELHHIQEKIVSLPSTKTVRWVLDVDPIE